MPFTRRDLVQTASIGLLDLASLACNARSIFLSLALLLVILGDMREDVVEAVANLVAKSLLSAVPYFRIECCNIAPCFYAEASTVSKPTTQCSRIPERS